MGGPPISEFLRDEENTTFSEKEQQRIVAALTEIKRQAAANEDIPEPEARVLNEKIDYLIETVKYTRRKEFMLVAWTTITQPFINGVLTPQVVQHVLHAIAAIFGHPPLTLGPGS